MKNYKSTSQYRQNASLQKVKDNALANSYTTIVNMSVYMSEAVLFLLAPLPVSADT